MSVFSTMKFSISTIETVLSAQDAKVPVLRRISIDHIWAVCVCVFFYLMNFLWFFIL